MQQQVSVITLAITSLAPTLRFYREGFGWQPVFENGEIAFYQMNGFVLGTWLKQAMAADTGRPLAEGAAAGFTLAHNVAAKDEVAPLMARLVAAGGTVLREADAPAHGGFRGYVADPDGHVWEIAWNPAWRVDGEGRVWFGV